MKHTTPSNNVPTTPKPIEKKDPVNEIIKAKRPSQRKMHWTLKVFFVLLAAVAIYAVAIVAKTYLAFRNVSVDNQGGTSPLLNILKTDPNALQGENDGRINVLLIGVGGTNHPGGQLADTIMVASIDPKNHSLALLSIPRDLRVKYPKPYSSIQDKINSVHSYGETTKGVQGGGPALLKETVSEVLDIPIHYFIRVDFDGFRKIVDTLGGVTVTVEKPIYDPYFPAPNLRDYQPFRIAAGTQTLNGDTALKYARSRETTSDFDRARRQQQVMEAVKEKAVSVGFLTSPKKVLDVIGIIGQHIKTDMQPLEIERFMTIIKDLDKSKTVNKVIDNGPDGPLRSISDGGYYLVTKTGDYSELQKIAHEIFTDSETKGQSARISVLNGSSKSGIALQLSQSLQKNDLYIVTEVLKAKSISQTTTIYDLTNGQKPLVASQLRTEVNNAPVSTIVPTDVSKAVTKTTDFIIVVGEDYRGTKKTN